MSARDAEYMADQPAVATPTLADLAWRVSDTARRLADSLVEFDDDPECCNEMVEAFTIAEQVLDAALGPNEDEDDLPPDVDLILTAVTCTLRDEMGTAIHEALSKSGITDRTAFNAITAMPEGEWSKAVTVAWWGLDIKIRAAVTDILKLSPPMGEQGDG